MDKEIGILIGLVLIVLISFITESDKIWAWIPAVIISWLWVFLIRNIYAAYGGLRYSIFGISLFPILAWPTLLMLGYFFFELFIKHESQFIRWLKMSFFWAIGLITVETVGYNVLGIHLGYGTQFQGWPILNCFHSPWWMQMGYFLNGFIFYGIVAFYLNKRKQRTSK
ncbi:hypothetical protein J7L48_08750 [bacterium]|nr:hypothetical protein [bacterium]